MKKIISKIIFACLLSSFLIGFGVIATNNHIEIIPQTYAANPDMPTIPKPELLPGPAETEKNSLNVQSYFRNEAIPTFISGFLGLISGLALLALIYAGVRFLTSFGEEEKLTEAKRVATWSILGFVIALLSYAIVSIVNTLVYPDSNTYESDDQQQVIYEDI